MYMKKSLLLTGLAAVLVLPACNKTLSPETLPAEPIRLVVDVAGDDPGATKSTANPSTGESKVNDLQIFVFNGDHLDGYGHSTNALTATVSCTAGSRDIYAVVNGGDLAAVSSKTALLAQVASLSANLANFAMIGNKTETLKKDGTVAIEVHRLAARVVLKGVKNALGNSTQAAAFKLKAVYLTNVAGDINLGEDAGYTVSHWYNQRGYQSGNNLGQATYDSVNKTVAANATYSTAHYLYAMPNAQAAAVGGPWTPRASKLVLRCEIAGQDYDYPITLPALQSNHSYEIDLVTITRPGNLDDGNEPDDSHPDDTDEEKPVVGFNQDFSITVKNWTVVKITDGTTI